MAEASDKSNQRKTVLVTGDVIVDHHVYMGERASHDSQLELGSTDKRALGGAGLLTKLLEAVSRERTESAVRQRSDRFDRLKETLDQLGASAGGPPSAGTGAGTGGPGAVTGWVKAIRDQIEKLSEELAAAATPGPPFHVHFDLNAKEDSCLPAHLHGYAIWKPVPVASRSKDFVWRIEKPLGYGSLGDAPPTFPEDVKRVGLERVPEIVVIDDAGLGFRFDTAKHAWPDALEHPEGIEWLVLKMARPLAHGALWDALRGLKDKLVVVVSIDDIRRAAVRVTRGISWERTALDLADELMSNDDIKPLLECRHLIINTRSEGALHADMSSGRRPVFRLLFDPEHIEEEWTAKHEGGVFGFTSCLTAGIVRQLATKDGERQLDLGIKSGLAAMRRLFREGHGPADAGEPGDRWGHVAQEILNPTVVYQVAELPAPRSRDSKWTIIASAEAKLRGAKQPLYGIAKGVALAGGKTLSHVPHGRFGRLLTVDRSEIEALRSIHQLIKEYLEHDKSNRPLSLAVFGPPGSGKSFAVKQMAKMIAGDRKPLEFNASQFAGPSDLIGAFHQVRDRALESETPFVFWDEFDCSEYRWLQYLLAPMQDGTFQEGLVTHPIGKSVFVFAGGTSHTMEGFGPERRSAASEEAQKEALERWEHFKLRKGPDFKSRIAGFLNVLGPNQRQLCNKEG